MNCAKVSKTIFTLISLENPEEHLEIEAYSELTSNCRFRNTMNLSTRELIFKESFRNQEFTINATQITAYQYLGMSKIASVVNMFPKSLIKSNINNE